MEPKTRPYLAAHSTPRAASTWTGLTRSSDLSSWCPPWLHSTLSCGPLTLPFSRSNLTSVYSLTFSKPQPGEPQEAPDIQLVKQPFQAPSVPRARRTSLSQKAPTPARASGSLPTHAAPPSSPPPAVGKGVMLTNA